MQRGFATVEMMMAMVIITMTLAAVATVSFTTQGSLVGGQTNAEALNIAEAVLEEEQALGRKDFNLVNATSSTDGFYTTTVAVEQQPDFLSKKVTVHVSWKDSRNQDRKVSLVGIVANFDNTAGGNTCNSSLSGNWKLPQVLNTQTDFGTLVGDTSGTYTIADVDAYNSRLYVVANKTTNSSDPTLFVFDINTTDPLHPTLTLRGKVDNAPSTSKGLQAIRVAPSTTGNKLYAYVANANDANFNTCSVGAACAQMQVIDVTAPVLSGWAPTIVNYKLATSTSPYVSGNGSNQATGSSILYKNGYVFLGLSTTAKGPGFHIIDVHNPLAPVHPPIASWPQPSATQGPSWGPVNSVYLRGGNIFLGVLPTTTSLGANQSLLILDITTDLAAPKLVGAFAGTGAGHGKSIAAVSDSLYLGRTIPNAGYEFHILSNAHSQLAQLPELAHAEINESVNGLIIRDSLAFLLTNTALQVVSATSAAPYASLSLLSSGSATEPSLDCEGDYLYAISNSVAGKGSLLVVSSQKP